MKISSSLAQNIVDNMRMVLNHQVNFMDMNGFIIASSDPERINTFHGGAAVVLKRKTPLFIAYDGQYEGARKGINMPIFFDRQVIGVIGVSGDSEVEKYTEIVKAMTEILIKEAYLNVMSFQNREKHRLIIETLLLDAGNLTYDTLFGIDFSDEYHVAVGSPPTTDYDLSYLHQLLESVFANHSKIFFTISHSLIIILAPRIHLNELLINIQNKANDRYEMNLNFGIGLASLQRIDMKKSFETAKQGLNWAISQGFERQLIYFEDLDLGMIVATTSEDVRRLFQMKIFHAFEEKDWQQFRKIMKSFAKHNGSLNACADELFIHKNTLQYQLNKIKILTSYDPRNYRDFSVLYMALLLHE
ncbi:MAG: helix-turn-helix domain-containing protein [Turicibacter sp.]|nr:helix-turn-helix domain-containing protein [Turicibacter sp.]